LHAPGEEIQPSGNKGGIMRSSVFALTLSALCVLAPAKADEATDAFRQMCMDTHADAAQAVAAADRLGWMALPQSMLDEFQKSEFHVTQGRIRSTSTTLYFLILGSGRPAAGLDVDMQICGVAAMPGAPEEFAAQGAVLAGVPKDEKLSTGKEFYVWREENGKHIQIDRNDRGVLKQLLGGALNFLVIATENKKMSMMVLAVPAAAKPDKP
jgi:hypothetical protein